MKLRIEKAIYGGAGLGRVDGKAVFVPMTLPGEVVEAEIQPGRDKGSFAEAALLHVLEPAAERVVAPCPYFGACGGCQYQHAEYATQLEMKRSILLETLGRAGLRDVPEVRLHSAEPWGYRNRIRLHVDAATHALGYRRRASRVLLVVDRCPIAAPLLERSLAALQALFAEQQAGTWCAEVELFCDGAGEAMVMTLRLRAGARAGEAELQRLAGGLGEQVPALVGAGLLQAAAERAGREPVAARGQRTRAKAQGRMAPARENRAEPAEDVDGESPEGALVRSWGERGLRYQAAGHAYEVSLGAFFQGNRFLVDRLVSLATDGVADELVWDLFAGVGLFSVALAERCERVVAVEGAPVSSADLRRNLGPGPTGQDVRQARHRAVESSTLGFLAREGAGGAAKRPGHIVLDPPRAGLGMEAARLLAGVRSQGVTYVSCDPSTLARDLRVLVDAGYTISQLHLADMFPQTFHLETVVKLQLR
ncbi:class I SAM-dependent RNA methyltransferase [Acidipila sp. EB88]|uniref:class I SAM-dependent RNA methyltransferase n=1 Tax=Acidipila sp. EB88 TaxID=2305226 RepID=UPI000F5FED65|nr:class I SAM-dependent RNA methyltransferase [Acidipila sp. EB88]RRA48635.1 class I SAM-dependent RNA methyltransferase [Acidipila sp. EB88]